MTSIILHIDRMPKNESVQFFIQIQLSSILKLLLNKINVFRVLNINLVLFKSEEQLVFLMLVSLSYLIILYFF